MHESTIEAAAAEISRPYFHADPLQLSAALAFLAKHAAECRGTIPILAHVHLAADLAGTVTLSATDLDNLASVTIPARVELPGAVCVDAGPFADAAAKLAKAKPHEVRFVDETEGRGAGRAMLAASRSRYSLKTMPADDFPVLAVSPDDAPLSGFTVPAGQLLGDLAALAPCQSTDVTRYYLCGVAMQVRDLGGRDRLAMVATDGHNMAVASRPLPAGAEALPDAIISRKTVSMIEKAAKVAGMVDAVAIEYAPTSASAGRVRFTLGAVTITAKLIDGTYPQWERAFEGGLAPTYGEPVMFPELLPGAPLASMDKLAKALKARIDWQPAAQGFLGTVPGDDGLLFGCLALRNGECQAKGYSYGFTGQGEAQAYLLALAEARGLTLPADIEARAAAMREAFGDDAASWDHNNGIPYRARPFGAVTYEGPQLITRGDRVLGLTVAGRVDTKAWTEKVMDWEALIERETDHPESREPIEGSYSILMPADGPGQLAGASAITGPDGVEYPVADNGSKIHFSKEQVRALIGESCFETMAITLPDGRAAHILRWLWDQGDSRFLTVRPDGRTYSGGVYVTRAEIEAGPIEAEPEAPAVDMPEIAATEPQESEPEPMATVEAGEADQEPEAQICEAGEPEAAPQSNPGQMSDPVADLAARVAALEARLATPLPAVSEATPISGKRQRTATHERMIRRAWAERARRREAEADQAAAFASVDRWKAKRAVSVNSAMRLRLDLDRMKLRAASAEARMERESQRAWDQWDKRRRMALLARQRGRDMAAIAKVAHFQNARAETLAAELSKAKDDLEAARMAPHYTDDAGRESVDLVGREASRAFAERDRADALQSRLAAAEAAKDRMQREIDRLADAMLAENLRANRAETALRAIEARANGWPPAVRSVNVTFGAAKAA